VEAPSRIVAVGDLLGDRGRSDRALALAGVLSPDGHWNAGSTVLVQLGDLIDPGPNTKAVVERWMTLADEAAAAGGTVTVLLGEHEALDLLGEWKEIAPADIHSFGDAGRGRKRCPNGHPSGNGSAVGTPSSRSRAPCSCTAASTSDGQGSTPPCCRARCGQQSPRPGRRSSSEPRSPAVPGFLRTNAVDVCGELEKVLAEKGAERLVVGTPLPLGQARITLRRPGMVGRRFGGSGGRGDHAFGGPSDRGTGPDPP
jgi:hypothetical protein